MVIEMRKSNGPYSFARGHYCTVGIELGKPTSTKFGAKSVLMLFGIQNGRKNVHFLNFLAPIFQI